MNDESVGKYVILKNPSKPVRMQSICVSFNAISDENHKKYHILITIWDMIFIFYILLSTAHDNLLEKFPNHLSPMWRQSYM